MDEADVTGGHGHRNTGSDQGTLARVQRDLVAGVQVESRVARTGTPRQREVGVELHHLKRHGRRV